MNSFYLSFKTHSYSTCYQNTLGFSMWLILIKALPLSSDMSTHPCSYALTSLEHNGGTVKNEILLSHLDSQTNSTVLSHNKSIVLW